MRCVLFFEFEETDAEKVYERRDKILAEIEKNPNKYPKDVFPAQGYLFGKPSGFMVVEGTTEQLFNYTQAWVPYMKFTIRHVADASKLPDMARNAQKIG